MLIDTHCHLADPAFDGEREELLDRARAAGVGHIVAVGENPERSDAARELARAFPGISATAGLH
ncbi:MAG: TatD family hydrolase, partial [Gemmatimonadota bacterium]